LASAARTVAAQVAVRQQEAPEVHHGMGNAVAAVAAQASEAGGTPMELLHHTPLCEHCAPRAVVTVPAYFNHFQRATVAQCAADAGWRVLRVLNEPTAAVLDVVAGEADSRGSVHTDASWADTPGNVICVVDVGGGTTDITVLDVVEDTVALTRPAASHMHEHLPQCTMHVLATGGDTAVGGDDVDDALLRAVVPPDVLRATSRTDVTAWLPTLRAAKHTVVHRVMHEVAGAALPLAQDSGTDFNTTHTVLTDAALATSGASEVVTLDVKGDNQALIVSVTPSMVHTAAIPVVKKCCTFVQDALQRGNVLPADVTHVVLAGGGTLTPGMASALMSLMPNAVLRNAREGRDVSVARGAARMASALIAQQLSHTGGGGTPSGRAPPRVVDVCTCLIGVVDKGRDVAVIVPRDTPLPVTKTLHVTPFTHNQTSMSVQVVTGLDTHTAANNVLLGTVHVSDLPSDERGVQRVALRVHVSADGGVQVTATVESTGAVCSGVFHLSGTQLLPESQAAGAAPAEAAAPATTEDASPANVSNPASHVHALRSELWALAAACSRSARCLPDAAVFQPTPKDAARAAAPDDWDGQVAAAGSRDDVNHDKDAVVLAATVALHYIETAAFPTVQGLQTHLDAVRRSDAALRRRLQAHATLRNNARRLV